MPRSAEARLEPIAAMNPTHVKESSLSEASATPPTIGSSVRYVCHEETAPRMMKESAAETTGSEALTMWVKETAPAPSEMTAPMCVPRWPSDTGISVFTLSELSLGTLRSPVSQSVPAYGIPTKSWRSAMLHGMGRALSAFLL
eukprot:scaffold55904_cov27-Tisochrysis_lutea.AAC.1